MRTRIQGMSSIAAIIARVSAALFVVCWLPALAAAAPQHASAQNLPLKLPATTDTTTWTIVLVLTLLTILPALLLSMTPFVRIIIVFHFLRQALGTQNGAEQPDAAGPGDCFSLIS